MEWLSQYWIWLVLTAGVFWLLARWRHGGRMAGCGSHGMAYGGPGGDGETQGTDTARPPVKVETADQAAARAAIERYRRGGGCC